MNEKEALQKLEAYCSAGEYCESEMREKLKKMELYSDVIDRIIHNLVENRFIDEERYANAYAHDKLRFSKWGRYKISMGLTEKRISQSVIDNVLSGLDDKEYEEILRQVIESRRKTIKGKSDYECAMKLLNSVARRGFEIPLIRKYLHIQEL